MAGIITTGSFPRSLLPGVNKWFGDGYNYRAPMWDKIFTQYQSSRNYEFDVAMIPTGLVPVKAQGDGITYDSMQQSFETRYVHVVYASGIIITREEVEDDLYDIVAAKRAEALGRSFATTKEIIAANVLNNGFSGSFVGGDNVALFSTAHPYQGGTYANRLLVDSDLSESALEQAMIDIYSFVDFRGKPISVMGERLIIPKELTYEAQRILNSNLRVATADNDMNAMKAAGVLPDGIHVNRYLTDTDAWFVITDCPDGMKMFERRALEVASDNDFDTENMKFKMSERYSFGWSDPKGAFGSPGA